MSNASNMMTLEQAIEAILTETKDLDWNLTPYNEWLRCDPPNPKTHAPTIISCCPITALCAHRTGKLYWSADFVRAARDIGIAPADATLIADAADNRLYCTNDEAKKVRERLLTLVKQAA